MQYDTHTMIDIDIYRFLKTANLGELTGKTYRTYIERFYWYCKDNQIDPDKADAIHVHEWFKTFLGIHPHNYGQAGFLPSWRPHRRRHGALRGIVKNNPPLAWRVVVSLPNQKFCYIAIQCVADSLQCFKPDPPILSVHHR